MTRQKAAVLILASHAAALPLLFAAWTKINALLNSRSDMEVLAGLLLIAAITVFAGLSEYLLFFRVWPQAGDEKAPRQVAQRLGQAPDGEGKHATGHEANKESINYHE